MQLYCKATARCHIHFKSVTLAQNFLFNHIAKLVITIVRIIRVTINLRNIICLRLKKIDI